MVRNTLIVLHYGAIIGYVLAVKASVFMSLFSLWCELVLLLLLYMVFTLRSKRPDRWDHVLGVITGAIPLLLLQYAIAAFTTNYLHEATTRTEEAALLRPLVAFAPSVIVTICSLAGIYAFLVWDLIREDRPLDEVRDGVLFQVLLLSVMGLMAIVLAGLLRSQPPWLVPVALAAVRIFAQPYIRRKFETP